MAEADRDGGRFQIVREIARGGMGRVVEAFDVQLGRTVALKQALDADPEARARFVREVEITARLEHPSIVPVYDAGASPEGEPFYVMRKVSGAPLDRLLAGATTLDERLAYLPNLLAVADAVAHAHARGVIHRDLKPANVLVGELGETVVIDWGLAKIVGEPDADGPGAPVPASRRAGALETTAGAVFGTPGFMAPEQVTGGATDARTDVYALGACLYAVLAGHPPFAGVAEPEILRRTVDGAVPRLPAIVAGVPPDLVTIVETAMATAPAARYLDAGGLSEELRRFLTGQLVASHRYGTGQRVVRWLRRRRALVAVTGVALAILITVAVIAVHRVVAAGERTLAALARERERADDLVVAQATSRIDTDPTLAIATLQELRPDSPRWATIGPIVAAARAHGVAVGYPGHGPGAVRVTFAPGADDARVLTTGNGTVRLHDLAKRTSTLLLEGDVMYAEWAGPLIAVSGRSVAHPFVLDPVTRAEVAIAWTEEIRYLYGCGGGYALFADATGAVAALDTSRGLPLAAAPVALPVTIAARSVTASPSGAWVIASGDRTSQLLRRDPGGAAAWTSVRDLPDDPGSFVWSPDESRLMYAVARDTIELDLATMTEQRWTGQYASEHTYVDGTRLVLDIFTSELRRLDSDGTATVTGHVDRTAGQSVAGAGDALLLLENPRTIALGRGAARQVIRPPVDVTQIAARDGHRYVLGITPSTLLAWDLDGLLPERTEVPSAEQFGFIADDVVLAIGDVDPDTYSRPLLRYRVGATPFAVAVDRVGALAFQLSAHFAPDGIIVAFEPTRQIRPINPPIPDLLTGITEIIAGAPGETLVGTEAGTVHAVTADSERTIATVPGGVALMSAASGWIAAEGKDGSLFRRDPSGTIARAAAPGPVVAIAITGHGVVVAATADHLVEWPVGGTPTPVAAIAQRPQSVLAVAGDRIAVVTEDGVMHLYDPATDELRPIAGAATGLTFATNRTRAAAVIDGGVHVIDFPAGEHWTALDEIAIGSGWLAMSPDGATLLAGEISSRVHALQRFDLDQPADLRAWVLGATNARRPALARGAIEWRPLASAP